MTTSPDPTHIEIRDLDFAYRGTRVPVFAGFGWTVGRGERWVIVGPSGCGKSTLLSLVAGLQQPDRGTILVGGASVPRPRASTGFIPQDHGLLPWATVRDNASLGLRMGRFYRHKQTRDESPRPYPPNLPTAVADHWLERLGLTALADKYPAQLSGGQRQRVAIARALALQPDLLLMDEPFSALDLVIRTDLQDLVVALQHELGLTTLLVTHSIEEAAFLGARILVLSQPPNRTPTIMDNPNAGAAGFRQSPAYAQTVAQLQVRLGAAAPA